jgi:hypothetical protein
MVLYDQGKATSILLLAWQGRQTDADHDTRSHMLNRHANMARLVCYRSCGIRLGKVTQTHVLILILANIAAPEDSRNPAGTTIRLELDESSYGGSRTMEVPGWLANFDLCNPIGAPQRELASPLQT